MIQSPILAPAAILILWSLLLLFWMAFKRYGAIKNANIDPATAQVGRRYQDIEVSLPPRVNWLSHNYTHLMEQPTLFYALVAIFALAGEGAGTNTSLAWAYVGFRIAHSLWQTQINTLGVRIGLFTASSLCLLAMAVNAVLVTLL